VLGQPGAALWADGLLAVEDRRRGPCDLELGFELGDRPVGLGEFVSLEGLHLFSATGIDQRLALLQVEGCLRHPDLPSNLAHRLTGQQSLADRSSKLPRVALGHGLPPGSSRPNSHNAWLGLRGIGHFVRPSGFEPETCGAELGHLQRSVVVRISCSGGITCPPMSVAVRSHLVLWLQKWLQIEDLGELGRVGIQVHNETEAWIDIDLD
jgi:hypothetical protein